MGGQKFGVFLNTGGQKSRRRAGSSGRWCDEEEEIKRVSTSWFGGKGSNDSYKMLVSWPAAKEGYNSTGGRGGDEAENGGRTLGLAFFLPFFF